MKKLIASFIILLSIPVALVWSGAFFIIEETEFGVLTEFKKVIRSYDTPGPKFKIPFLQEIHRYPAKILTSDSPPENVVTGDQKKLFIDNYVKYKIQDPVKFRNSVLNVDRAQSRISIITHNAIKDVVGTMNLAGIINNERGDLSRGALKIAQEQSLPLGIEIVDIQIKRVTLPKINVSKAFERMKAERFKEANFYRSKGTEESTVIRAETDKEISITLTEAQKQAALIRAAAEAQADSIYNAAYGRDPEFYKFYRSLQALKKTMDNQTTLVISPESELYRYLIKP